MSGDAFATRWASPPGETVSAVMHDRGLSAKDVATGLALEPQEFTDLLLGRLAISGDLATALAASLGASASFWLARDAQYWEDVERVEADRWSGRLPLKYLSTLGWISEPAGWQERTTACLEFFGVSSVSEWDTVYASQVEDAMYRTSAAYELEIEATAVWFRACELSADAFEIAPSFSLADFEMALERIRSLTRLSEPSVFIPALVAECAAAGVRVVVVRAPKGCTASGATRLWRGQPLIALSARFLSDDHFWFSFYHEAGHVVLHDISTPHIDADEVADSAESEANDFASRALVGLEGISGGRLSPRRVIELAQRRGVSPGIVVGQMQHRGLIRRNTYNSLKRRYVWAGTTLERAGKN